MNTIKWVKQLTRENTLLDRSLRTAAYYDSVRKIGAARFAEALVVGFGSVSSFYYSAADYRKQRAIIAREFHGPNMYQMSEQMVHALEQAYRWSRAARRQHVSARQYADFFREFQLHHAHARGAIVYGYWGEPSARASLRAALRRRLSARRSDAVLSLLSSPRYVPGVLQRLRRLPSQSERQRLQLMRSIGLSKSAQQKVEHMSWLTFFYEYGEFVAGHVYQTLVMHLRHLARSDRQFHDLEWYDPISLKRYFQGKRLSPDELDRRRECYIIEMKHGRWKILSGKAARQYYHRLFGNDSRRTVAAPIVKGMTAQPGRVVGTVRIVIRRADQASVCEGDIIVSPMTTPHLMTAVRKAAAIVTDEGGMTAHAAIVARELKVPCVVGTKNATTVFKDGDMVEVDAQRGIVRKLPDQSEVVNQRRDDRAPQIRAKSRTRRRRGVRATRGIVKKV
ncbi:MAG: PEP-utilizing enzyme [Patescibacteria group bacterium]